MNSANGFFADNSVIIGPTGFFEKAADCADY